MGRAGSDRSMSVYVVTLPRTRRAHDAVANRRRSPATPTSSVEAVQVRATDVRDGAVQARSVGTVGGPSAGVVADTGAVSAERLPDVSRALTAYAWVALVRDGVGVGQDTVARLW